MEKSGFYFSYKYTFFFHWKFILILMKTNVFCICYEPDTLVDKDKREYKDSFESACNGIWPW